MRNRKSSGFTLTEMLIVIGIILVVSLIALPIFRTMTGANSTEAAYNQLAGLLGRARAEAVGLQQVRGVAFFIDRETQQVQAVQVKQAEYLPMADDPLTTADDPPQLFIDFVEDRDPVLMPRGVGLQMVDDCELIGAVRQDDAYIGFNTVTRNNVDFTYGGAILFDGYGRIVAKTYGVKFITGGKPSNAAKMFEMSGTLTDFAPRGRERPRSQFGFVVYDSESFKNQVDAAGTAFTDNDPQMKPPHNYPATELAEEMWLDDNGVAVLVNRTNGTLVKGK